MPRIIRSSADPDFRKLVEKFQLCVEHLSSVGDQPYVSRLPTPSLADMPEEMITIVKFYNKKVCANDARGPNF